MNQSNCCGTESACSCSETSKSIAMAASTALSFKDYLGACAARLGVGRMDYMVEPGLYAVGKPDEDSPVLVSANYKLTFDTLRKSLSGLDCWLLILDTKGVNVWCAAGKGTFGTEELLNRLDETGLSDIVAHRRLILPQLGAPGVNASEISSRSRFSVTFGPVRANDIRTFILSGCKATKEMRTVRFTVWDRLILTPLELVKSIKVSLTVFGILFLINLFAARPFGVWDILAYVAAVLIGVVITPAFLPFVPGKAFAFKGWLLGAIGTAIVVWTYGWFAPPFLLLGIGYMLALPAYSAFWAMNFTGASTYTSPSGVLKEMKIAIPLIAFSLFAGVALIFGATFAA